MKGINEDLPGCKMQFHLIDGKVSKKLCWWVRENFNLPVPKRAVTQGIVTALVVRWRW